MENRRTFLGLAASLLPAGLEAQAPASQARGMLATHALTGPLGGYEVVISEADMRHFPGSSTPAHRHPGALLAYVVEGQVRFAINNEPERIVSPGGTFFEPFGSMHTTSGSASPDKTARILIFEVRPKGGQVTMAAGHWETLARGPIPETIEPILTVNGLTMPVEPVREHSHAGPVVGYILQGEIENQVEPEPPAIHKPGGSFYEPPRHVHKIMRNLSPEPAKLIIVGVGRTQVPASLTKVLTSEPTKLVLPQFVQWQVPFPSTANQELRALRLTLPAGARAEAPAHSGPGIVYVVEGTITTSASPPSRGPAASVARSATAPEEAGHYAAGDLILDPARATGLTFTNASKGEPAKLLLYHIASR